MAGDLNIRELAVLDSTMPSLRSAAPTQQQGRTLHRYGRIHVLAAPDQPQALSQLRAFELRSPPQGMSEVERLGLAALQLRETSQYQTQKANRPRASQPWDMHDCTKVVPTPRAGARRVGARAAGATSSYLEGTVAVGIVIVQGPTAALRFSEQELTKVVAEVQNGLGFLASENPMAGISFSYDIQNVNLAVQPDPSASDLEGLWRDPAMATLGYGGDWDGVLAYVEDLRERFGTRWTYRAFFTKYPLGHFAYASIGGPRLVMDYNNDGWGPDNIDRVFAHETGHIFGAPDEYASSGCNCGGGWGRFGIVNANCENCAGGGGVPCLMKGNSFTLCNFTPSHLGWGPQLLVRNFGFDAGGWRVERHPRFLADTTGDGRADIVGFGNAGVWVARAQTDGRYETPQLVVGNFGYDAGGWRVEQHPRALADINGDGRAHVVGFGDAGVWVSLAQADGTFTPAQFAVASFGFAAAGGGWRTDRHPRVLADVTGDGRADIVGFGEGGVWVALAQGNGTFSAPQLVIENFGATAGGWRVDRHPRFLADTRGIGRKDVVGFGNAGVWVALSRGDGTFDPPQLVVSNFGYGAGGWRVEAHPRVLADTQGNGRADIVGFGNAGVWVALSRGDGTFDPPQLAVGNFGYDAGGWRVDRHPRLLADTTGDGRADLVGFGDAGVLVARSLGNGTFDAPALVIPNFGYDAGGWRVTQHPIVLADSNGGGRADVVGFGNAGVWVSRL